MGFLREYERPMQYFFSSLVAGAVMQIEPYAPEQSADGRGNFLLLRMLRNRESVRFTERSSFWQPPNRIPSSASMS